MNKRILSILLCLTLVASLLVLAIPVNAASAKEITVTADKTTANPGDEITFTVSIGPVTDMANITTHVVVPDGLTIDEESISFDMAAFNAKFDFMFSGVTLYNGNTLINDGAGYQNVSSTDSYDIYTFKCKVDDDATGTLSVGFNDAEFVLGDEASNDLTSQYTCKGVDITVAGATTAPETTAPETTAPETTAPETTAPETTAPETTAPETTSPETTAPETQAHVHNIIEIPEVPASEEAEGVLGHYECTECGKLYWDVTGTIEITNPDDLIIEKVTPVETTPVETTPVETTPEETTPEETIADETTAAETTAAETVAPTKPVASPDSAATPDSTKDTSSPKTGDSTHMYLWMLIMLASLVGACAVVIVAKRKGIFTK